MIHEVAGDILLSGAQALAHGVAPDDSFTCGLALAVRRRWPPLYAAFLTHCRDHRPRPGDLWSWTSAEGRTIVSLFTQDPRRPHGNRPGRSSLRYLARCLASLRDYAEAQQFKSLALPRIATGAGGLDWELARPVLDEQLGSLAIPVILYDVYRPEVRAPEPL